MLMAVFLKYLILLITVLVSVAFFTLFERKILSYSQSRVGPTIVGVGGLLQPFSDAVKLFCKGQLKFSFSNSFIFFVCPFLSLFLSLVGWAVSFHLGNSHSMGYGAVFLMCVLSVGVYSGLGAGWASSSKYSLLGALRSVAQTISYEVSMALIIILMVMSSFSYNLVDLVEFQKYSGWLLFILGPLSLVWFASLLAETNRTPFDFSEGESELVSGFNTEYSGGSFALFFLAEYSSILLMSLILSFTLVGGSYLSLYLKLSFFAYLFILIRATLPRFRYDKLMLLAWKSFLSVTLGYFCLYLMFVFFMTVI